MGEPVAVKEEESKVTKDKKASKQAEKVEEKPSEVEEAAAEPVTTKVEEDKLPSTTRTTQVAKETKEREPTKEAEAEEAVDEILVSETVTFDETKEEDSIVDNESNENSNEAPMQAERKEQPVTTCGT